MNDNGTKRRIVKTYPYYDEAGELLYEVVRYDPKDFRTRRRDAAGKTVWKLDGVRKVLYRLPEIVNAEDGTIFVCEGEKDVDRLVDLGMHATTCQGSVNGWLPEFAQFLKGNRVVILPDNDETGRKFAAKVSASLAGVVDLYAILELPNLPEKGDVSDWLDAGNGMQDLYFLAGYALDRKPERPVTAAASDASSGSADDAFWTIERVSFADIKVEKIPWLWRPTWMDCSLNLLVGLPDMGKTFVACHLAAAVSRGMPWPDGSGNAPQGRVVFLTTENSLSQSIKPRLLDHGADVNMIETWTVKKRRNKDGTVSEKEIDIEDLDPIIDLLDNTPDVRLIVADPVTAYLGKAEYMKNEAVRPVMQRFLALCAEKKICGLLLTHLKKSQALAINSIQGAQAFVQVPRITNGVYLDPDDERRRRRCLVPIKNNEGQKFGRRFSLEDTDASGERVHIVWDEEREMRTADELMAMAIAESSAVGRENSAETAQSKSQAHFLGVLDAITPPGDGWVRARNLRDKLNWGGSRLSAAVFQMVQGGILEERHVDRELPNGATDAGGVHEIRRRRHSQF